MKKRILSGLLTLCLLAGIAVFPAYAEPSNFNANAYFKNQLTSADEIAFYEALEAFEQSGDLQTGVGSYTLGFSNSRLKEYAEGDTSLVRAYLAARDAFSQDRCELFYIDFSKLTFRVGLKSDGSYEAFLNSGSYENYLCAPFKNAQDVSNALNAAKEKKEEIINQVKQSPEYNDINKQQEAQIVTLVHDILIKNTAFAYPSGNDPENVHGIYGALVNGKGNCEGYARSMKWILDDFDIPCVLITGVGQNSKEVSELHMWNAVQIDENWYGVDATWDDPVVSDLSAEGTVRNVYLLRGSTVLSANHFESGFLSSSSKEFTYPTLSAIDFADAAVQKEPGDLSAENNNLKITANYAVDTQGDEYTEYRISYEGLNVKQVFEKAEEEHVAVRYMYPSAEIVANDGLADAQLDAAALPPGTVKQIEIDGKYWDVGPWFSLEGYELFHTDGHSVLVVHKQSRVQFCITKEKPQINDEDYSIELEDEGKHLAITKPMLTPYYNNYIAPPFIHMSSPELTRRILAGNTYHYSVTYTDVLQVANPAEDISFSVYCSEPTVTDFKVENFEIKDSTYTVADVTRPCTVVEFDFTPSESFQGYINIYSIYPKNLVGKISKKAPNPVSICSTLDMRVPCPSQTSPGGPGNAFIIAMPTLIVNENMNVFEDGDSPLDIRLVASIPGKEETDSLLGALQESGKVPGGITEGKTATYDLSLGCENVITRLKQGDYNVTIGLPYPAGFNYEENKDVVFKAYHYKETESGSYKVEELICQITPRGLIVIANDFSPFTIVQLDKSANVPQAEHKLINVSSSIDGGEIYTNEIGAGGLYAIESGTQEFQIKPKNGYEIERITINGKALELTDEQKTNGYTQIFDYSSMETENNLQASFIAQSVKEADIAKGFVPVAAPELSPKPETPEPTPEPEKPEPETPSQGGSANGSTDNAGASSKNPPAKKTPASKKPASSSKPAEDAAQSKVDSTSSSSEASSTPEQKADSSASSPLDTSSASSSAEIQNQKDSSVVPVILLALVTAAAAIVIGVVLFRIRKK